MLPQLGFAVTPKTMLDFLVLGASLSPWLSSHRSIVAERQWSWCPFTSTPKNNTSEAIFGWRVFTCYKAYGHSSFYLYSMQANVNLSIPSFLKDPNYPYDQESIKYWLVFFISFFVGGWLVLGFSLYGNVEEEKKPKMVLDIQTRKTPRKEIHVTLDTQGNRTTSCKHSQTGVCANCNSREGFQPA